MTRKERTEYIAMRRREEKESKGHRVPGSSTFGTHSKARQRRLTKIGFGPKETK